MIQWIITFIKTGRTVMKVQCEKPSLVLVGLVAGWLARSEMKYRCTWIFECLNSLQVGLFDISLL